MRTNNKKQVYSIPLIPLFIVIGLFCLVTSMQNPNPEKTQITIKSGQTGLMTKTIQNAIDSCATNGGGVVIFPAGIYLTGGIELKSNITLQLDKGALLQGSDKYSDYKNDAFIFGENLSNVAIRGEGTIDGVNCINTIGEEGFRGPHCIRFLNCKNLSFNGFTITRSANWAFNFRGSSFAKVDKVTILGGHDGLHTRFCNDFTVSNCDFRTGDDAYAGNDNRNFLITDSKINTSCNGFRMGCLGLTVKRCHFWGPGEAVHKISARKNMLSAFVHFSPDDDSPKLESGNWLIEDCTIENVDQVYVYNYLNGLWQTGQPVTSVQFKNIKATGILVAFNVIGDTTCKFNLGVKNSSFSFREGFDYSNTEFEGIKKFAPALINAANFDRINLQKVSLSKLINTPILNCKSGNEVTLKCVNFTSANQSAPYTFENVKKIRKVKIKHNNTTK